MNLNAGQIEELVAMLKSAQEAAESIRLQMRPKQVGLEDQSKTPEEQAAQALFDSARNL